MLTYSELNCFYITCGPTIDGGLIGYVDRSGSAWTLMEDDDNWVDACIVYLKSQVPVPVINDHRKERLVQFVQNHLSPNGQDACFNADRSKQLRAQAPLVTQNRSARNSSKPAMADTIRSPLVFN